VLFLFRHVLRLRVSTLGIPHRESLGKAIRVNGPDGAIDPTEAECLLHGIIVGDARPAGVLLIVDEPDFCLGLVVPLQPGTPLLARGDIQDLVLVWAACHGRFTMP